MKLETTRTGFCLALPLALLLAGAGPKGSIHRMPDRNDPATIEAAGADILSDAAVRLEVLPTGNEVRYLVQEQLAGFDLPNDAVGRTSAVTGALALDGSGGVIAAESNFVIEVGGLTSDKERRDGYVRRRILATDSNPTVVLQPTELRGVALPLPESGTKRFELVGNLTVKGVTRSTSWRVEADFAGDTVSGTAATAFTFDDFQIAQPRVPIVLSVADTIRLEYDFRMAKRQE